MFAIQKQTLAWLVQNHFIAWCVQLQKTSGSVFVGNIRLFIYKNIYFVCIYSDIMCIFAKFY